MTHRRGQHRFGAVAYLATIDSDIEWGQTAGVPRNPHAEHLSQQMRCQTLHTSLMVTTMISILQSKDLNGGISADARAVLQSIDESVLNIAE